MVTYLEKLKRRIEEAGYTFAKDAGAWQCLDGRILVASATNLAECIERAARALGESTR